MRMRDEKLKTSKALAWIDESGNLKSRVLLFLVRGADDIAPLDALQAACRSHIESSRHTGFNWYAVADPGQISSVDRRLSSADIHRFEVCEFRDLDSGQLASLLNPIIDRIVAGESDLVPRVGGAVGSPAEGVQFLNRTFEVAQIAIKIRQGVSIFLKAPRRMGKTSLMRQAQKELEGEFTTLVLNFERDPSPVECAARLRSIQTGEGFHKALPIARATPNKILKESLEALCARSNKTLVLFVDELVALFEGTKEKGEEQRLPEVLSFLDNFATPLEDHAARIVVAGSIDWKSYLESQLQITNEQLPSLFSCLEEFPVHPLDLEHPECELRRLLLGSGLVAEPEDVKWLLSHVDLALPYPATRFLDSIVGETKQRVTTGPDDFQRLLKEFLANTDSFADFDEHLRLKCPFAGGADRVAEALGKIALNAFAEGASEAEVKNILSSPDLHETKKLESWLRDTFPVKPEGGRVRFVSRLFREWWLSQIAEEGGRND